MSPGTGNQLSCWSLQSRVFGWWYIPGFVFASCRAFVPFALFPDILNGSEPPLLTDLWPAVRYLICVALLLFLSLTSSLCDCKIEKKPKDLCVFFLLERKKQQLYRHHVWKQKNSASTNQWLKKQQLTVEPAPLCSNSRSEERRLRLMKSLDWWSPLCLL